MILLWNRIHFDGPLTVLVYAQPCQCTERIQYSRFTVLQLQDNDTFSRFYRHFF